MEETDIINPTPGLRKPIDVLYTDTMIYYHWNIFLFLFQVVPYVASIIGPNVMAAHTMLINKPPDSGQALMF